MKLIFLNFLAFLVVRSVHALIFNQNFILVAGFNYFLLTS
jgi:hypothetical protein